MIIYDYRSGNYAIEYLESRLFSSLCIFIIYQPFNNYPVKSIFVSINKPSYIDKIVF